VAIVKILFKRSLSLKGDNKVVGVKKYGNYLGILEFISQFGPFLKEHISKIR
jgi:hypothetical protein